MTSSVPGRKSGGDAHSQRRGIAAAGLTSFFSDTGHEIATSLLPAFLTSVLGASAAALGVIEGCSDALTGIAKLVAGSWANDPAKRGRLASRGYLGTAVATGAIGVAGATWQAGVLRAFAWSSRGVRSPARDSIVASLAEEEGRGRAFGVERAGDNLGAVAGPLLAAWLAPAIGIRHTIYLAFVPGVLAAITITFAVRHVRSAPAEGKARHAFHLRALRNHGLGPPMVPVTAFELGNIATTLLILRSTQLLRAGGDSLAVATSVAVFIYATHNAVAALASYPSGRWIDRRGARAAFVAGAALYVLAYAGFSAGPTRWWSLLVVFSLAGCGIGLAETAESALVASLLPDELRGSGYGLLGGVQAAGDLGSSVVVGVLYAAVSPTVAFAYAASWMALSVVTSGTLRPTAR